MPVCEPFFYFFVHPQTDTKTICLRLHWPKLNSWKWTTITKTTKKLLLFSVLWTLFSLLKTFPPLPPRSCVQIFKQPQETQSQLIDNVFCPKTAIIISKPSNKTLFNAHILGIIYLVYLWMAHRYYVPSSFTFSIDSTHDFLHLIIQHSGQFVSLDDRGNKHTRTEREGNTIQFISSPFTTHIIQVAFFTRYFLASFKMYTARFVL